MRTVSVPLLLGVGGAQYGTEPGGALGVWAWGITGLPPESWTYQRTEGEWRLHFTAAPGNDNWLTDAAPGIADGFQYEGGPTNQVTSLPAFKAPFSPAPGYQRGLGGALTVRSFGFAAAHTVPPTWTNGRLRVEFVRHSSEGGDCKLTRNPVVDSTFEPSGINETGWSTLSIDAGSELTTVVRENHWGTSWADDPSDGYTGQDVEWWPQTANLTSGYWLRLESVRAWAVYDLPPAGQWPLRQRQSRPGAPSWPLRQRQNGAASGGWPLRQRQRGA